MKEVPEPKRAERELLDGVTAVLGRTRLWDAPYEGPIEIEDVRLVGEYPNTRLQIRFIMLRGTRQGRYGWAWSLWHGSDGFLEVNTTLANFLEVVDLFRPGADARPAPDGRSWLLEGPPEME